MKKRMTEQQEFEIMKLVLDKFLWLGLIIMLFGVYKMVTQQLIVEGFYYIIGGAVALLVFLVLIVKEYEIIN
ncbi:hypothetical protein KY342_06135 [Candidatus Woesearchaeota archaeon]|nr:hypothetical protein [Candidatus Woesearchaeota archaeon]